MLTNGRTTKTLLEIVSSEGAHNMKVENEVERA